MEQGGSAAAEGGGAGEEAAEIEALLDGPPWEDLREYYTERLLRLPGGQGQGLAVRPAPNMGKGLFAERNFEAGEEVLRESMLVGMQHSFNRAEALVCSHCLAFVGSVPLQLARRLPLTPPRQGIPGKQRQEKEVEASEEGDEKEEDKEEGEEEAEVGEGGEGEVQAREPQLAPPLLASFGSDMESADVEEQERGGGDSYGVAHLSVKARRKRKTGVPGSCHEAVDSAAGDEDPESHDDGAELSPLHHLPPSLQRFLRSQSALPFTEQFPLPSPLDCPGGCETDVYCSTACIQASWLEGHALLCTGPGSLCPNPTALVEFQQHAHETNDVFHLAAKVLAYTMLRVLTRDPGWKCRMQRATADVQESTPCAPEASGLNPWCSPECAAAGPEVQGQDQAQAQEAAGMGDSSQGPHPPPSHIPSLPLHHICRAWLPFAAGHKAIWWDAVALPGDVPKDKEAEFRDSIKATAIQSLALLKQALLASHTPHFLSLFHLDVYASIVGMFELNNLDVVVPSPVARYAAFLSAHAAQHAGQDEAVALLQEIASAIGPTWAEPCRGNAFYAVQSCVNHSCAPSTRAYKAESEKDGSAVLLATRAISSGEQVVS